VITFDEVPNCHGPRIPRMNVTILRFERDVHGQGILGGRGGGMGIGIRD
jgi:hypothetical protein